MHRLGERHPLLLDDGKPIPQSVGLAVHSMWSRVAIHQDPARKTVCVLGNTDGWRVKSDQDTIEVTQEPVVPTAFEQPRLAVAEQQLSQSQADRLLTADISPQVCVAGNLNEHRVAPALFSIDEMEFHPRHRLDRLDIWVPGPKYLKRLELDFRAGGELIVDDLRAPGWRVSVNHPNGHALSVIAKKLVGLEALGLQMADGLVHIDKLVADRLELEIYPAGVMIILKGTIGNIGGSIGPNTLLWLMGKFSDRSAQGPHREPIQIAPPSFVSEETFLRMVQPDNKRRLLWMGTSSSS